MFDLACSCLVLVLIVLGVCGLLFNWGMPPDPGDEGEDDGDDDGDDWHPTPPPNTKHAKPELVSP